MDIMDIIVILAMILGPAGAGWIGVKTGLNGVKADIKDIKENQKSTQKCLLDHERRISHMEGPSS